MLKHYLRVYNNYKQNNWSKLLLMITFVDNNNVHVFTKKKFAWSSKKLSYLLFIPFNLSLSCSLMLKNYVAKLKTTFENKLFKKEIFSTIKRANWFQKTKSHLMNLWKKIVEQQNKKYNKRHENKIFRVENKMLLRNLNIRTFRLKKKIDHKQLKLFVICEKIDIQIYKLDLSKKYNAIHSIFHVFY